MILRIDDIGASTKTFNQYGKKVFYISNIPVFYFPLANFWFFKKVWPFKGWGPYKELLKEEWLSYLEVFKEYQIKPIIAITACWCEKDSSLTPFFEKFPEQSSLLKKAFLNDDIIIANHGLSHCVIGKHLPLFFGSNRRYHREFWPYLTEKTHFFHILKSQKILEDFFEKQIEIFVPPGNIWSHKTYEVLKKTNIKKVIANRYMADSEEDMIGIDFIDDREDFAIMHDRDLKLKGVKYLKNVLKKFTKKDN